MHRPKPDRFSSEDRSVHGRFIQFFVWRMLLGVVDSNGLDIWSVYIYIHFIQKTQRQNAYVDNKEVVQVRSRSDNLEYVFI